MIANVHHADVGNWFRRALRGVGYTISNAVWFDASSSDYLSRTPSSAGNRKTWTFSAWVKRGQINALSGVHLFGADRGSGYGDRITWGNGDTDDRFNVTLNDAGSGRLQTKAFFRDPTAWTHFVVVVDTTQSTAANRVKIYINGTLLTASDLDTASYPAEDYETAVNNTAAQMVGARGGSASQFMDGYMAEVIFLDGTGVWVPVDPSELTFGTNGFHLKFDEANLLGKSSNSTTNPTVSFLGSQVFGSTAQTFTVSGATLGDAASNRTIVVAAGGALNNSGTRSISSLTVGGSSATFIARKNSGGGNTMEFWSVALSSGTSGDIVATFSGGNNNMNVVGIAWWRVLDVGQAISTDGDTGSGWSTQAVTTIGQTGDVALYALFDSGSITNFNWSDATERADHPNITSASAPATFYGFTAADYTFDAAESHTETVSPASGSGNDDSYIGITLSNNNSFTANSMAAANKVTDTPTDDAENNIGNYATLSPIDQVQGASVLSLGNLKITGNNNHSSTRSTFQTDGSGKFAWEVTVTNHDTNVVIGLMKSSDITSGGNIIGNQTNSGWALIADPGSTDNARSRFNNSDMVTDLGAAMTNGDVYHLELNNATGDVFAWRKPSGGTFAALNSGNTITAGAGKTALAGTPVLFAQHVYQNTSASDPNVLTYNFGQTSFAQTPSSGYKAVNTANLAAPTHANPDKFMAHGEFTMGTSNHKVSISDFNPSSGCVVELLRIDASSEYVVGNTVLGAGKHFNVSIQQGEQTDANLIHSYNSDGVTFGTTLTNGGSYYWRVHRIHADYCDVQTRTGTGSAHAESHNLNHKPGFLYCLADASSARGTYHSALGATKAVFLDDHNVPQTSSVYWNDAEPTDSQYTVGTDASTNASSVTYYDIMFTDGAGLCFFGSFTGNGADDGPVVNMNNSKPKNVMVFRTGSATSGYFIDYNTVRNPHNVCTRMFLLDNSGNEYAGPGLESDILATGWKARDGNNGMNASEQIIISAWGLRPLGGSGVAQARAR